MKKLNVKKIMACFMVMAILGSGITANAAGWSYNVSRSGNTATAKITNSYANKRYYANNLSSRNRANGKLNNSVRYNGTLAAGKSASNQHVANFSTYYFVCIGTMYNGASSNSGTAGSITRRIQ